MLKERKCPVCGKWTDSRKTHCTHCNALSDPQLIAEKKRAEVRKKREENELANESKTAKILRKLESSKNPIHRAIFFVANIFFNIYMAILSFIMWLIAVISG